MNVGVHTTTPKSIPWIVYSWNIGRNNKQCRRNSQNLSFFDFYCYLMYLSMSVRNNRKSSNLSHWRCKVITRWLRWQDCRMSVQVTPVRDGFTTSVSRRFIRPQWNEYENSGKLLYRSHTTNASANLRFCPRVSLRCNWTTRALHFSKDMSSEIRRVPSTNVL